MKRPPRRAAAARDRMDGITTVPWHLLGKLDLSAEQKAADQGPS